MPKTSGYSKLVTIKTNAVVLQQAIKDSAVLITFISIYTGKNLQDLDTRNTALQAIVGNNTDAEQKENTYNMNQLNKTGKTLIANMRTFVEGVLINNPERAKIILSNIGLILDTKKGKEALMVAFNTYANNIADNSAELVKAGILQTRINEITTFGATYIQAVTTQAVSIGNTRKMNAEENKEYEAVFTQVKVLSRIAQRIFKDQPEKAELYNYSAIAKRLSGNRNTKKTSTDKTTDTTNKIIE